MSHGRRLAVTEEENFHRVLRVSGAGGSTALVHEQVLGSAAPIQFDTKFFSEATSTSSRVITWNAWPAIKVAQNWVWWAVLDPTSDSYDVNVVLNR
jgi:hypothetical protein